MALHSVCVRVCVCVCVCHTGLDLPVLLPRETTPWTGQFTTLFRRSMKEQWRRKGQLLTQLIQVGVTHTHTRIYKCTHTQTYIGTLRPRSKYSERRRHVLCVCVCVYVCVCVRSP